MEKTRKKKAFWGFDLANIDASVKPTDDFFHFANGHWIKKNPIPPDESRWGSFYVLRKNSIDALHKILEETKIKHAGIGSDLQKLRDYYLSAINEKHLNKDGTKPLFKYFEMVDKAASKKDLILLAAAFHQIGVPALWQIDADQDMKNKNKVVLYIEQGGLGLPDRDYYLKEDKKSKKIRQKYLSYIGQIHKLVFGKTSLPKNTPERIMKIETRLARASMTQIERRDYEKQYNRMRISDLNLTAPNIEWKKYFSSAGVRFKGHLIVMQPLFIKETNQMLSDIPLEDWKIYFKWKVINAFAGYLNDALVNCKFDFYGKTLSGMKEIKPRWRRAVAEIDWALGDILGRLYVKKHFSGDAKKRINQLVDNLIAVYAERIKALDWMSEPTKKKALEKLRAFSRKLGYPDQWKSYKTLKISPNSYLENHISAYRFEFSREMRKLGKKPDKKEWHMTPPTVNAYNNFLCNEIVFPAGIMQPPFFDPQADDAVNYGGIGWVIGHELTHGFDDKGSTFDKNGEMKNWWSKRDRKLFEKKAEGLVRQFDKFEVLPGVFIKGKLTLGENIADLGGLVVAYYAYQRSLSGRTKKIIDGLTPEQRFFLGAAQSEQGHAREEEIRLHINTDPHSPSKARVNIPLSNMNEFYEAFDVKEGDKMFIPKKERVTIW